LPVRKGISLSRPQLQEAATNLLSLGISITDTSKILGISTYLVRCLVKGSVIQSQLRLQEATEQVNAREKKQGERQS